MLPQTHLPEKYGASRGQSDQQCAEKQNRAQNQQSDHGGKQIECPFSPAPIWILPHLLELQRANFFPHRFAGFPHPARKLLMFTFQRKQFRRSSSVATRISESVSASSRRRGISQTSPPGSETGRMRNPRSNRHSQCLVSFNTRNFVSKSTLLLSHISPDRSVPARHGKQIEVHPPEPAAILGEARLRNARTIPAHGRQPRQERALVSR